VLRVVQETGEMYGVITEKLGGGHAMVACMDNVIRMVLIGKKFRNERLTKNQMVMIGLREWQTKIIDVKKSEKCDLLEVYTDIETDSIIHKYGSTHPYLIHLIPKMDTLKSGCIASDVVFTNDEITELSTSTLHSTTRELETLTTAIEGMEDEDWFNSI
jgi:translation initiation factor IF-1